MWFRINDDLVAQLVEQQTLNLWVEGSNPSWVTIISDKKNGLMLIERKSVFFTVKCEVSIVPFR